MSLSEFTFLDFVIMVIVSSLVLVGFFAGVARIVAGLISIYLSTLISAAAYDNVAEYLRDNLGGMGVAGSELMSFMMIFLALSVAFFLVVSHSTKSVLVRRHRLAILDNVGGAALAITAGILTIGTTLSISVIILGAFSQSSSAGGVENLGAFGRQIRDSQLVPRILELQPPISASFELWFPNGLPPILEPPPDV